MSSVQYPRDGSGYFFSDKKTIRCVIGEIHFKGYKVLCFSINQQFRKSIYGLDDMISKNIPRSDKWQRRYLVYEC